MAGAAGLADATGGLVTSAWLAARDHAACGASGADMTSWRVRTTGGAVVSYIAADTPRTHDGLVFRVSRASHDRRTPTPSG